MYLKPCVGRSPPGTVGEHTALPRRSNCIGRGFLVRSREGNGVEVGGKSRTRDGEEGEENWKRGRGKEETGNGQKRRTNLQFTPPLI